MLFLPGLVFISVFNFFYLVKINKLIFFFNLEVDVGSHVDTMDIILIFLIFPFASCAISVSDVTSGTKTRRVFQDRD